MSKNKENNIHHLHVEVPKSMMMEFRSLFPTQGIVPVIIRKFIVAYTKEAKIRGVAQVSPAVLAYKQIEEDIERGYTNGIERPTDRPE